MRKVRFGLCAVAIFALFFLLSCSVKVDPAVAYKGTYRSYVKVLKQWTRSDKVYDGPLDAILYVTATYESHGFRKAYLEEQGRAEKLPTKEMKRLSEESDEELSRLAVFTILFFMPEFSWNKLDKSDSGWRLWLVDASGTKVAPVKIKKIKIKNPAIPKYYPYWNEWSTVYRVTFPRKTDSGNDLVLNQGKITLEIAGILGAAALQWEIPATSPK